MSTTPQTNTNQAPEQSPVKTLRERAEQPAEGQGITLTEVAAQTISEKFMKDCDREKTYLYVGVKGGGCSGFQWVLDLRDESVAPVKETDMVFLSHDVVVVCDLKSFMGGNLGGTTIDYKDGMMGAGFVFNNPNAKRTCGCGSSYSA